MPTPTDGVIRSAYNQALLDARTTGLKLSAAALARLQAQLRDAAAAVEAMGNGSTSAVTAQRARVLQAEIEATLDGFRAAAARGVGAARLGTVDAIVGIHQEAVATLYDRAGLNRALVRERLDGSALRAVQALNARQQRVGSAGFATLMRRNVADAGPVLDRIIGAGIARGVSADRLTKDIARILRGETSGVIGGVNVDGYGLPPRSLTGLATVRSDAYRIAVTEIGGAQREANNQALLDAGIVLAAAWQRSGRHKGLPSSPDECDYLATADLFGFGPGLYPPESWPTAPHPICGCVQGGPVQYRPPDEWSKPRPPSQEAIRQPREHRPEFVDKMTDARRERLYRNVREAVPAVPSDRLRKSSRGRGGGSSGSSGSSGGSTGGGTAAPKPKPPAPKPPTASAAPAAPPPPAPPPPPQRPRGLPEFTPAATLQEAVTYSTRTLGMPRVTQDLPGYAKPKGWGRYYKPSEAPAALAQLNTINAEWQRLLETHAGLETGTFTLMLRKNAKNGQAFLGSAPPFVDLLLAMTPDVKATSILDQATFAALNNGRRWWTVRPGRQVEDTFRHELGHRLTYQATVDEFNRATRAAFGAGHAAMRAEWWKDHVSVYGSRNKEEMIAELFGMVTADDYVAGTLPAPLEAFVEWMVSDKNRR